MRVKFREAVEEDLAEVVALLADDQLGRSRESTNLAPYLAAFREIAGDPNNAVIVGEAGGRIVASYQLTVIPGIAIAATKRAQIEGVRVVSDLRSQGIGAQMLADAEARARVARATLMQLTMNATRDRTRAFYEANGYAPSHTGFKKTL